MLGNARELSLKVIVVIAVSALLSNGLVDAGEPSHDDADRTVRAAFDMVDVSGGVHRADEWTGKKAIVLLFIGAECPVSNSYSPEFGRLAKTLGEKGVLFFGVHCDEDLTAAEAAKHAKEYSLTFPILLDPKQKLATAVGARTTPETVLLSPTGDVLYRGRIDDRYALDGKRRDEPSRRDLEDAIIAVLAGQKPAAAETKCFGCPLPRLKR
jgi:peroxiredoxin